MKKRLEDDNKRVVNANVIPKVIGKKQTERCIFNHKIIDELYKHDFEIPLNIIKGIKQLPKETLIKDLLNVLNLHFAP